MKKKRVILVISLVIVLLVAHFGYKGFLLFYYNTNSLKMDGFDEIVDGLKIKDTMTINRSQVEDGKYLEFKGIKVKNDFEEFTKLESPQATKDSLKLVVYNEDNSVQASFWMSEATTYLDILKAEKEVFGNGTKAISTDSLEEYLKSKNINNDIDLFKYLREHKNDKNSIFTSSKRMKEHYSMFEISYIILPKVNGITLIDGDYTGYIFNMDNMKEVNILKNDKRYVFIFINTDYFTDEYIKELLETVVID